MSKPTIVLCFPLGDEHVATIRERAGSGWEVVVSDQDRIAHDILLADIFCGHAKQKQVDWDYVVSQGRLKWIQSSAAGLDHCLAPSVVDSEIVVSGCSALFAPQVAEQTMALLFGLLRSMPVFFRAQQAKEFVRRPTDEIQGKTVGILGFGGNGQQIARALSTFRCKLVATDCFVNDLKDHRGKLLCELFTPEELEKLLAQSDIVIITLPLTLENDGSFGKSQFEQMKPNSYLVNVGRGSVVDHAALTVALESGHLAGAAFDVCEPEPLPQESPLWEMGNVIISPHVGAQSVTRIPETVKLFCENLARFGRNEPLRNLVDKQLGFPRPEHRIV